VRSPAAPPAALSTASSLAIPLRPPRAIAPLFEDPGCSSTLLVLLLLGLSGARGPGLDGAPPSADLALELDALHGALGLPGDDDGLLLAVLGGDDLGGSLVVRSGRRRGEVAVDLGAVLDGTGDPGVLDRRPDGVALVEEELCKRCERWLTVFLAATRSPQLTLSILNDVDLLALDDHLDDGSGTGRLALVDSRDSEGILLVSSLDTKALATGERLLGLSPSHHEGLILEPEGAEEGQPEVCGTDEDGTHCLMRILET